MEGPAEVSKMAIRVWAGGYAHGGGSAVASHIGRGGTDRSKVGNSKKRYYPINFWILIVK